MSIAPVYQILLGLFIIFSLAFYAMVFVLLLQILGRLQHIINFPVGNNEFKVPKKTDTHNKRNDYKSRNSEKSQRETRNDYKKKDSNRSNNKYAQKNAKRQRSAFKAGNNNSDTKNNRAKNVSSDNKINAPQKAEVKTPAVKPPKPLFKKQSEVVSESEVMPKTNEIMHGRKVQIKRRKFNENEGNASLDNKSDDNVSVGNGQKDGNVKQNTDGVEI